jgi:hypothetical protein
VSDLPRRGVVTIDPPLIGGIVVWSPDGAGQVARFPTRHKVVDAAVKDGKILLLIEGEQMPEVAKGEQPQEVRMVISSGYPIAEFKKVP